MEYIIGRNKWLFVLPLLIMFAGCAKSVEEDADEIEKNLLEAYIIVNNINVEPTSSGLYFINQQTGTGATPSPGNLVHVNYTGYDLKGNVLIQNSTPLTNNAQLAKQLGSFSKAIYYGPKVWELNTSTLYSGLEEALYKMKEGGKARIIMPSWLSNMGDGKKQITVTTIFDIELLQVIGDNAQYETDTLEAFSEKYYGGADSLKKDWYYVDVLEGIDTVVATNDTLKIWYVGYLLDGFVFDTNIADSAKYHGIYNSSKSYEVLSAVYNDDVELVSGFKYAFEFMKEGGEAVTFFSSNYGYGSSESGQIQRYAPLRFYIKLERIGRVE